MKLSIEEFSLLINALGTRPFQHDEKELLHKLHEMRQQAREAQNHELEANEN
jgi:hypothetical protein